ncbi:MAG TPA: hypothetical protein VJP58_05245 [Candidatus Nitrosocosmicus sp.]|nr:hypothetical protein [Candidatus Nitrosocosmicus sp.]
MSKNSTTNTAIRIPTEIYEKIEFQASTEDKTVSSVINNILRKYVSWDQFVSDIGFVFLQKPFVRNIFEHVSDEDLIKAAKTSCYTGMRDAISFIHGKNDVESIVDVLKLWFSASNFTNKVIQVNGKVEFRIQHNLGRKGSLYIGTLMSSLFADLNMKSTEALLKEHSLVIVFNSPSKK